MLEFAMNDPEPARTLVIEVTLKDPTAGAFFYRHHQARDPKVVVETLVRKATAAGGFWNGETFYLLSSVGSLRWHWAASSEDERAGHKQWEHDQRVIGGTAMS